MATVDLVIPVYNEEQVLARSVETVLAWCERRPEHEWRVVVANNASTDGTLAIARRLEEQHPGRLAVLDVAVKGRGLALRTAWLTSAAEVSAYMDVDLSSDLEHLPALVDPIAAGEADLTFGTRLHARSQTQRGLFRETLSRGYVLILNTVLGLRVSDAQCGFKAISREAARAIVPLVRDRAWFFDTELLWVAQRNGYRLREVPVRWVEDTDSSVAIVSTVVDDLRGIWRLRTGGVPRVARGPHDSGRGGS
ncbi:MAG: dolichyl-phosphate beta-glucosyltransferase [Dehalococcoidia bacterium]